MRTLISIKKILLKILKTIILNFFQSWINKFYEFFLIFENLIFKIKYF